MCQNIQHACVLNVPGNWSVRQMPVRNMDTDSASGFEVHVVAVYVDATSFGLQQRNRTIRI